MFLRRREGRRSSQSAVRVACFPRSRVILPEGRRSGRGTHLRLSAALTLVFFLARFLVTFLPLFALVCAADAMVRLSAADFFARSRSLRDFVM